MLLDSKLQFVVASDVGVGAVLSQWMAKHGCLHLCAFLSHKLFSAERNYDIGNKELLAVKVSLEVWRHWLEVAEQPFLVWTDQKNLEYLQTPKRLNSRQARWALFFNRFNFHLSHRLFTVNLMQCQGFTVLIGLLINKNPSCLVPASWKQFSGK